LNISVFFHEFTKERTPKHKNHAQDCGTLLERGASGDPAMVFAIWMTCILSVVTGTLPVMPSGRIAAGRLRLSAINY
jgi:hypothetical protein